MQTLVDTDILTYCHDPTEDRQSAMETAANAFYKPVYALPVFELCRALHLLTKYHHISAAQFRVCWAELAELHWQHVETGYLIHMCEYPDFNLPLEITRLGAVESVDENDESYWDHHRSLTMRLRQLHPIGLVELQDMDEERRPWAALPPEGKPSPSPLRQPPENDDSVVVDTNNLLELLDRLPETGNLVQLPHLPVRLSDNAVRRFRRILANRGLSGRFIVPVSVLEETERVARREFDRGHKYGQALQVLQAISLDPDMALWNAFSFEPLTQDIFECFIQLYEGITAQAVGSQYWPGFGDMLVLAHGLYHGCPVASNEWFEKPEWNVVAQVFSHLVLR